MSRIEGPACEHVIVRVAPAQSGPLAVVVEFPRYRVDLDAAGAAWLADQLTNASTRLTEAGGK